MKCLYVRIAEIVKGKWNYKIAWKGSCCGLCHPLASLTLSWTVTVQLTGAQLGF